MRTAGFVAHDHGARETLEALGHRLPGAWLAPRGTKPDAWEEILDGRGVELLVCGTSDSSAGRAMEAAARRAACRRGTPLIVIEDFPGNYASVPDGAPQLLFVESSFAAQLGRARDDAHPLAVEICPSVRYDPLRRRLDTLRRKAAGGSGAVLWVGQPETRDSIETLRRLLPALAAREIALWFRAHPRDEGYARGDYRAVLAAAGVATVDLSPIPLEDCLQRRPELVLTQFSSVAIEAGFWGICAVHALFADLGGRTLEAKKGYAVPPWCEAGAAFPILHQADVEKVLGRALGSEDARAHVLQCFDRYFNVHEEGSQRLINVLYNHGLL